MVVKFEQKLGAFKGKIHLLFWEARPDMDSLEEFVVNVSYSDFRGGEPKRVQIVRIDNVGKPLHLDQLWKEGEPKEELDWRGTRWGLFSEPVEEIKEELEEVRQKMGKKQGVLIMFMSNVNVFISLSIIFIGELNG